jgi:ParB family chromosome partitioning protein
MKRSALGKGLEALIPGASEVDSKETAGVVTNIPLDKIKPNRFQPRKDFDSNKQAELVESIKEGGLIQPIIVRKTEGYYEILVGERRFKAIEKLGWETIPVIIHDSVDNETAMKMALIENIQREDLNPIEEANAYNRLLSEFNLTQADVAAKVGKDRTSVTNSIRLLSLNDSIKNLIIDGKLSAGHGRALLAVTIENERDILAKQAVKDGLSVRELEKLAYSNKPKNKTVKLKERPAQIVALEDSLKRKLATKVTIAHKRKGGKITIEYYSDDELNRLLEVLGILESF